VRKRRRDPVADPSSLGPRTLRLRKKQAVPMVEKPKVDIFIFLIEPLP